MHVRRLQIVTLIHSADYQGILEENCFLTVALSFFMIVCIYPFLQNTVGDSAAFRPSVLALSAILLHSQNQSLPEICTKLIMNSIRHDPERLNQILQCIDQFRTLLFGNSQDSKISLEKNFNLYVNKSNNSPMSDTTAYPDSETTDSSWDDILG